MLVNPGMGITTFQRFNGQPLNQGLRWSEKDQRQNSSEACCAIGFSRYVHCLLPLVLE